MARALDDDAPRRVRDANERIYVVTSNVVLDMQERLALRRRLDRIERAAQVAAVLAVLAAGVGALVQRRDLAGFAVGAVVCGGVLVLAVLTLVVVYVVGRGVSSRKTLEANLAAEKEKLWGQQAERRPDLAKRREMYREEASSFVEQYQDDSRRYRRIHNWLQALIMIGSASTTTIAALDTGKELTWQSVTLTVISFSITLAAMFTGYYKFRERSYFLQQTADLIEEEVNAVTLGIGPYRDFGTLPEQEKEALKLFTQRVEEHRNEQRRRQQQLDQPSDQATPTAAPPTG